MQHSEGATVGLKVLNGTNLFIKLQFHQTKCHNSAESKNVNKKYEVINFMIKTVYKSILGVNMLLMPYI